MRFPESVLRGALCASGAALLLVVHGVAALGVHHVPWPPAQGLRTALAAGYAALVVALVLLVRPRWRSALVSLAGPAAILLLYAGVEPKRDAVYPPETSRAASVTWSGSRFTLHDVRDFDYRTESDFDARWEDREYDLDAVRTVDLFTCYWTQGRRIAHAMLSFGFADGRFLAVSIEVRREADEVFDALAGFFKRYEILYVWADERDVVRLRTNYRRREPEEVHLFRVVATQAEVRALLRDYLETTQELRERPEFYNTITRNCASSITAHVNASLDRKIPWYRRRLQNGMREEVLRDAGWIEGEGDLEDLHRVARINERALAAGQGPDFSRRIRTHLTD